MISYEQDLYAWTLDNVALLRTRQFDKLDVDNLIEELEYMARKDKMELVNRLAILLMHLLKWQFQVMKRSGIWEITLKLKRLDVCELLELSPSLKYELELEMSEAYRRATLKAAKKMGLSLDTFPPTCPYTLEQILDDDFYPSFEAS